MTIKTTRVVLVLSGILSAAFSAVPVVHADGKAKPIKTARAGKPHAGQNDAQSQKNDDDAPGAAGANESGGKAGKTKVLTFTGLDLEGKLKTPQLLYFLNRVRVELDSSTPAKRSFMKELEQTADDKGL